MEYISIIDIGKHFKYDLEYELSILHDFIVTNIYDIQIELKRYFNSFPFANFTLSARDYINETFWEREVPADINRDQHLEYEYLMKFDFFINVHQFIKSKIKSIDNFEKYCNKYSKDPRLIIKRCKYIISTLGYKLNEEIHEGATYGRLVKINPTAEHIAKQIENKHIALNILEYNVFGLEPKDKKRLLSELYTYFELHRNLFGNVSTTIATLVNYIIKHPIKSDKNIELDNLIDERTNIYDDIFELFIQGLYNMKNNEIIELVKKTAKK